MDDIRHLLDSARRRLVQSRFLRGLHYGVVGASILVLLVVALMRTSPAIAAALPLTWVIGGAAALAVIAAALYARSVSLSPMTLAVLVDERLGLKERLSTALAVKERSDAFAQAAVSDGVTTARDGKVREALGRSFPVQAPNNSWIGPAIALAAFGAWFLPQGDFFTPDETQVQTAQVRNEAKLAETAVKNMLEKNEKLEKLAGKLGDVAGQNVPPDELPKTPDDVRREAIKNLTDTQRKLNEMLKGDDAQKLDAIKNQLANLDPPPGAEVGELSKALKEGDFKAAQDALEKLKAEASKEPAKKAEIEKQLGDLSKQIEKLGANKANVEEALKKANLDPKLANSQEALERALENSKNLTEQQKQDIRKAAQAQQQAQKKLQELSKACNGACNNPNGQKSGGQQGSQNSEQSGDKSGSSGSQGQKQGEQASKDGKGGGQKPGDKSGDQAQSGGSGSMSEMLTDLESLEQMLQDAEAAMNEADKQAQGLGQCMGEMPGQCQSNNPGDQIGNRRGGHGRANGGSAGFQKSPTATKIQKEKVELTAGDIISRQAVEGQSDRGESSEQLNRAISEIAQSMEQGVTEEDVPQHLKELHKVYFGEVKARLDSLKSSSPPAAGDSGAKPAAPAGSASGSGASPAKPAGQ
jgi:predicted transcriptional regulator